MTNIIIVPENDSEKHDEESTTCKCNPRVEFTETGMIIIHNAFDQRDLIEKVAEILNPE